jgi:multiple sugar transport system ATP-binding protein
LAQSVNGPEAAGVELVGVSKTYAGNDSPSLQPLDLTIDAGDFFSILGPSGCGKTTMLRIIAGFETPSSGRVLIGGRDVTALPPRARDIAMVFQDYALYPHMSAGKNIGFNLRNRRVPKSEIATRVGEVAERLGIAHLLGKKPAQLSGGERQRVALGRALVRQPRVFLLDEPLSNLDVKLREVMRIELARLHQDLGITMIYVTHDQIEAMTLSTELAVMRSGELQQRGQPDDVYRHPHNVFVARFIGSPSMNLLRMRRAGAEFVMPGGAGKLPVPDGLTLADGEEALVGVRPHAFRVSNEGDGVPVTVSLTEHLGRSNHVVCDLRDASADVLYEQESLLFESPPDAEFAVGSELRLTAEARVVRVFSLSGEDLSAVVGDRSAEPARAS